MMRRTVRDSLGIARTARGVGGEVRSRVSPLLALLAGAALLPNPLRGQEAPTQAGGGGAAREAEAVRLMPDPPRGPTAQAVARRIEVSPVIDGVLDEPFWATLEPITDFVQREPVDGGYPSERTEVRIAYDQDNLYFGFLLFDSEPDAIRASVLHRGGNIGLDDHIVIGLDTFLDRRNGYIFEMNSLGTQDDAIFTDESIAHQDWSWDGVYRSETTRTDEGWVLEVAIPFTTIRFPREEVLEMGLLFFRSIRRKNETVFWPHLPSTYRGRYAQSSQYGTLVGLEGVRPGRNLQVKPYLLAGGQKPGATVAPTSVTDVGLDVKYSLTSSLTLDLTWNTDFAQVEADNVQVNLDRFSLFFPEKREFFLERAGLFAFGDAGQTQLFFSRRIGLQNPILGGARLTGQAGRFSLGLLNLQTGEEGGRPGANNAVARVRADLGARGSVGGLLTNLQGDGLESRAAGADLQLRFLGSSSFDAWAARIDDPAVEEAAAADGRDRRGPGGGMGAGAASLQLRNATWGASVGYTNIGRDFLPALGFVRRPDQVRWNGEASFSPRFEASRWARQFTTTLSGEEIEGQDGVLQSGRQSLNNQLRFESGEQVGASATRRFERLAAPFAIRPGVLIPVGDYTFSTLSFDVRSNGSRRLSGGGGLSVGRFYHGERVEMSGSVAVLVSPRLNFTTRVVRNEVSLPVEAGDFVTNLVELTVKAAASRKLFADALVQYDDVSRRIQTNLRVNWIHTPGSNLFVVLDTGVNTGDLPEPGVTRWERRTGVVKLTYLWAL